MSKAKFIATKELINEGQYDLARAILKTMPPDENVEQWLRKLDRISPQNIPASPPRTILNNAEQDKYYKRENKLYRRRRFGAGLQSCTMGIVVLAIFAFFIWADIQNNDGNVTLGFEVIFLPLGLIGIVGGLIVMMKRE